MTGTQKTLAVAAILAIFALAPMCRVQAGEVSGRIECVKRTSFCLLNGLALRGEIDDEATAKLRRLLEELDRKSPPNIDRGNIQIELDSPGGSVAAAMEIGRLMRKYRMAAAVKPNSICVSACVLIYAGAVARLGYNEKARIGIHQPYFQVPDGQIEPEAVRHAYTAMLVSIRAYFTEMNVSPQLADEMLKTPPSGVRYLSAKQQERFGLSVIDPIELETTSLTEAKKLGLDRREYNRREALSLEQCPADSDFYNCHQAIMKSGRVPLPDLSQFGTPVE